MMRLASVLSLLLLQGNAGSPPRELSDALATLSVNVKESQDQLPDFLCNERITSTTFKSGKKQDQKVVESIFSIQNSRENREILSVDGKPAKKGAKMPGLPVNITGSFNYMINTTFVPAALQWYEFSLGQNPEPGRLVVHFETKTDQKAMTWNINGDGRLAHDTGQAWIDTSAMQVARLERNLLNLGRYATAWKITIDQTPFTIGERQFWLPKMFLTEITERDQKNTGTFLAEYSNCKKFTTEISIRPLKL
jgi:hypothetical protein